MNLDCIIIVQTKLSHFVFKGRVLSFENFFPSCRANLGACRLAKSTHNDIHARRKRIITTFNAITVRLVPRLDLLGVLNEPRWKMKHCFAGTMTSSFLFSLSLFRKRSPRDESPLISARFVRLVIYLYAEYVNRISANASLPEKNSRLSFIKNPFQRSISVSPISL